MIIVEKPSHDLLGTGKPTKGIFVLSSVKIDHTKMVLVSGQEPGLSILNFSSCGVPI